MTHSKRFDYIDIARGICIGLMVVGHSYSSPSGIIWTVINSFHMQFFFLASGIIAGLKTVQSRTISQDICKKLKTTIIPYFFWITTYEAFVDTLAIIGGDAPVSRIRNSLILIVSFESGSLWFLPVFCIAACVFILLQRLEKKWTALIGFSCFLVSLYLSKYISSDPVVLQYIFKVLGRSAVGVGFMTIGYLSAVPVFSKKQPWYFCLFILAIDAVLIHINGTTAVMSLSFHDPLLFVLIGSAGSWLALQFSMRLEKYLDFFAVKNIRVLGQYSIVVLCLHRFIIQIIRLIDHKLLGDLLPKTWYFEGFIMAFIVLTILYLLMPLILRLFWWSFGVRSPWQKKQVQGS